MPTPQELAQARINEANALVRQLLKLSLATPENKKDDLLDAIELYEEALDLYPTAAPYVALAYISCAYDDLKNALIFLKSALNLEPNNPDALKMMAQLHKKYKPTSPKGKNLSEVNKLVNKIEGKKETVNKAISSILDKTQKNPSDDFFNLINQTRKK